MLSSRTADVQTSSGVKAKPGGNKPAKLDGAFPQQASSGTGIGRLRKFSKKGEISAGVENTSRTTK